MNKIDKEEIYNNMNMNKIDKEEIYKMYKIYTKCYSEWCKETDEIAKSAMIDINKQDKIEFFYYFDCERIYFDMFIKEYTRSLKQMIAAFKEDEYMLDIRVYNYMNKLNSNN